MHPLPQALAAIDGLQGLDYVKGKDKVLLVRLSTGIVVDEVTMRPQREQSQVPTNNWFVPSMIPKSGRWFSEKIMLRKQAKAK